MVIETTIINRTGEGMEFLVVVRGPESVVIGHNRYHESELDDLTSGDQNGKKLLREMKPGDTVTYNGDIIIRIW